MKNNMMKFYFYFFSWRKIKKFSKHFCDTISQKMVNGVDIISSEGLSFGVSYLLLIYQEPLNNY